MRWDGPDGYWVSDDPALLDVTRVHGWMSAESYWAQGREYQVMATAIEHSLVFGLYAADGTQAGFARPHRLGSFLVEAATSHPDVGSIRQVLMAAPERGLYRRLGFAGLRSPERWLERRGEGPG